MDGVIWRITIGASAAAVLVICTFNPQACLAQSSKQKTTSNSVFEGGNPCSHKDRNIGAAAGALIGAIIGYHRRGKKGAAAGAVVGAGGGALIGRTLDKRRCNLYQIAQANHLRLASASITPATLETASSKPADKDTPIGLDVQLENNKGEFVAGTAQLTPEARKYIGSIAKQYVPEADSGKSANAGEKQMRGRKVLIVGHADESSDPAQAAQLTQQRARVVAEAFKDAGVPPRNIYYQGAGGTLPIASNGTAEGRAENNRVQIVDVPNDTDLRRYLQLRQPNAQYFSAAAASATSGTRPSTTTAKAAPRSKRAPYAGYNFGGAPLTRAAQAQPINLGNPIVHSTFSIISAAQAGEPLVIDSCIHDQPRVATAVRNLATGRELPIRDYVPGFYGAPWLGGFHGNLIVIDKAFVPRDSGTPAPRPRLLIYKNYKGNAAAKPSYQSNLSVNVYRGDKAILYRMFVEGPLQCIDLVKPNRPGKAVAKLYYLRNGETYLASGAFALQK